MKPSPKMKLFVEAIGQKFGIDFSQVEASIRLDMPHFDRLCIENIGYDRISVAHYFESNGDLVAEPDVVFLSNHPLGWVPIEITQSFSGYKLYLEMADDDQTVVRFDQAGQADLAEFTESWAQNLNDQKWLAGCQRDKKSREESSLVQLIMSSKGNINRFSRHNSTNGSLCEQICPL